MTLLELAERFWSKIDKRAPDECWPWIAGKSDTGYGSFGAGSGKIVNAHRFAYEMVKGPIPTGLHLDHLCRNRLCCNPAHLEPVTPAENSRRGIAGKLARERAALITHCPRGHAYDEVNTYVHNGKRSCKACAINRQNARRAAMKEAGIGRTA